AARRGERTTRRGPDRRTVRVRGHHLLDVVLDGEKPGLRPRLEPPRRDGGRDARSAVIPLRREGADRGRVRALPAGDAGHAASPPPGQSNRPGRLTHRTGRRIATAASWQSSRVAVVRATLHMATTFSLRSGSRTTTKRRVVTPPCARNSRSVGQLGPSRTRTSV